VQACPSRRRRDHREYLPTRALCGKLLLNCAKYHSLILAPPKYYLFKHMKISCLFHEEIWNSS
jgi:hypothetical protein